MITRSPWIGGQRAKWPSQLPNRRYSTCCNILHIKTGTVLLGILELLGIALLFYELVRQLRWKNKDLESCIAGKWNDCVLFHFSHFNLTLISDYLIALLLCLLFLCVLLLFYGVLVVQPKYLRPHLVVQAIGLVLSLAYFILYGWSYFYGDLYTQNRKFSLEYFVERMWLSTLLLVFFGFQCYLFLVVLKCSLYLNVRTDFDFPLLITHAEILQTVRMEKNIRKMQFQEVSDRVRRAKENGLWRSTSWGGGFQQYKGQHEKDRWNRHKGGKKMQNRTVQWDLKRNIEKSLSRGLDSSNSREDTLNGEERRKGTSSQRKDRDSRCMSTSAIIPTRIMYKPMSMSVIHIGAKDPHMGRQIRCGEYELESRRDNRAPNYDGFNQDRDISGRISTSGDPGFRYVKKVSIYSRFQR